MAKRTRFAGRSTARRPAANRLVRRDPPKAKPLLVEPAAEPIADRTFEEDETGAPVSARGIGLSQAEIDRAAELEAEMTTRERAIAAATKARGAQPIAGRQSSVDVNAPLSVRASKEYAYVARDVRRIALTAGLMVAILVVVDVLVNVAGLVRF